MWCSNQLSYRTIYIEQILQTRRSEPRKYKSKLLRIIFFRKEVFLELLGLRRAASRNSFLSSSERRCSLSCLACAELHLGTAFCLLQKGGVPAAPSGTATLLRLSPNHQFCLRPILAVTDFRHPRLSWLDGRCVQGPGTYSPRHG